MHIMCLFTVSVGVWEPDVIMCVGKHNSSPKLWATPCEEKKFLCKHLGDKRSVMTLSQRAIEMLSIFSPDPETMTYQSLTGLQIGIPSLPLFSVLQQMIITIQHAHTYTPTHTHIHSLSVSQTHYIHSWTHCWNDLTWWCTVWVTLNRCYSHIQ